MAKSWQEKMADKPGIPKILQFEARFPCYHAVRKQGAEVGDPIVLVNPGEVAALMARVPAQRLTTLTEICQALAAKYQVRGCCTLTAGIFTMTAANAAEEMQAEGKVSRLPYWRTLKSGGELNPKYPGGLEGHAALLAGEGFTVIWRGKKAFVLDYENHLYCFED